MTKKKKVVTINDVAKIAGTSISSVSAALNNNSGVSEETKNRILRIAKEIGYNPDRRAQLLRKKNLKLLGLIYNPAQHFQNSLIDMLYNACNQVGYDIIVFPGTKRRTEAECLQKILNYHCDGVILVGTKLSQHELINTDTIIPTLSLCENNSNCIDSVYTDDNYGISELIKHLTYLGHKNIVYVDGNNSANSEDRRAAYQSVMENVGLSSFERIYTGGSTEFDGSNVARSILSSNKIPTAIMAFNDMCAFGIFSEFLRANYKMPADISITGYDDTAISELPTFNLTTVHQEIELLTALAVRRIVDRINGTTRLNELSNTNGTTIIEQANGTISCVVQPRIIIRGTTGISP